MTPGSIYRQTGRIVDLLGEPTFDVGADPAATRFYSFRIPHYDADGHGLFDIPVVFCEQIMFAPVWVFSAALRLTGSEPYLEASRPRGAGIRPLLGTSLWAVGKGLGWSGVGCYFAGLGAAMAFDTVVHDAPVIVVGRPLRWLRSLGAGR